MIDYDKIALEFAKKQGKDTIRYAGEKDGFKYYHYFLKATLGNKLGLGHYIKINKTKEITRVFDFYEIMWAKNQEVVLNNL